MGVGEKREAWQRSRKFEEWPKRRKKERRKKMREKEKKKERKKERKKQTNQQRKKQRNKEKTKKKNKETKKEKRTERGKWAVKIVAREKNEKGKGVNSHKGPKAIQVQGWERIRRKKAKRSQPMKTAQ